MEVKNAKMWQNYTTTRNDCVRVITEERTSYENDVMDKCKEEPKLFFRCVRSTMKTKKVNGQMCEDLADMAEMMNKSFHLAFTMRGYLWGKVR